MIQVVKETVREFQMLQEGDGVLVGVSGGPDSMALLHVLVSLAPKFSLDLAIAHLNHGLREPASDRDARFVAHQAAALGLPCFVEKRDVAAYRHRWRLGMEEAGRRVRYAFFAKTAEENGYLKIALGHQADDNAELVLMNLLRGSGPEGLSGIPPVRPLREKSGRRGAAARVPKVIRPCIKVPRRDIIAYLSRASIAYVCDDSNADLQFLRNRVRHQLIPQLQKSYNPDVKGALNRLSAILRSEADWAGKKSRELFAALAGQTGLPGEVTLPVGALAELHPAACRRLIRMAVGEVKGDLRRISFAHVAAVQELIGGASAYGRLDLPGGIRVFRDNGRLTVTLAPPTAAPPDFSYAIPRPGVRRVCLHIKETGDRLRFSETGLTDWLEIRRAGHRIAFFDMDKLTFPLTTRNFQPGDRFAPLGMTGTKKVKRFFIDNGIPRGDRPRCPLLVSAGEIIWIAGHRMGASAQVCATTRRVLKAELFLA